MARVGLSEKIRWVLKHEGLSGLCKKSLKRLIRPNFLKQPVSYDWKLHSPDAAQLELLRLRIKNFSYQPVISILLPVYDPDPDLLIQTLESVRQQIYPFWQLCIADDASNKPGVRAVLEQFQKLDTRIKVCFREQNGHIAKSSNSALELVDGEFLALLDHDDLLAPHALFCMVHLLQSHPEADLIYSNEDKIEIDGTHTEPAFKPNWSPEYFLSFMYIGHLTVYRTALVRQVGGFRAGFEGSQDYDLALRVTELTDRIYHIPEILYHWRKHQDSVSQNIHAKPYAFEAGKQALREAMQRRGFDRASVTDTIQPGIYQTRFPLRGAPEVLLVCYGQQSRNQGAQRLQELGKQLDYSSLRSHYVSLPQNFSASQLIRKISQIVEECQSEYMLLLDDRLEVHSPDLVQRMLEHTQRLDIGAVGGRILTPARDYIHAGYLIFGNSIFHNFYGTHRAHEGYGARLTTVNNVSAVSFMCCMTRSEEWQSAALQDRNYEQLVAAEIDFCLELQTRRKRIVFSPYAVCSLQGDVPPRIIQLDRDTSDYKLLERAYRISEYRDPFYPRGLDTVEARYNLLKIRENRCAGDEAADAAEIPTQSLMELR